jgi:MHS family citrate/tricarballylate:H+ symporter-like MFS transporter
VLAAALGYALNTTLTSAELADWGWRVPFFVGCMIIPCIFVLRRSLQETADFSQAKHHPSTAEVFASMRQNWRLVLAGMLLVAMTTTTFYLITVYTPTFGKNVLHLSARDSLVVTLLVAVSNFVWLPIGGALSDRIGRKPLLLGVTVLAILTAYPVMAWLASEPSFARMLQALLWLSFLFGMYNGAMVVALTEVMPKQVRVVGFSLAYSLATAVFGGFTPAICTWLIDTTADKAAPGYWLSLAAVCGMAATLALYRRRQG